MERGTLRKIATAVTGAGVAVFAAACAEPLPPVAQAAANEVGSRPAAVAEAAGCVNYAYTMSGPPVAYEGTAEANRLDKSCQGPNIPENAYFKYRKYADGGYYADVYCSSGRYYDGRRGGCVTPKYIRLRR